MNAMPFVIGLSGLGSKSAPRFTSDFGDIACKVMRHTRGILIYLEERRFAASDVSDTVKQP